MKPLLLPMMLATTLALTACANNADTNADTAAAADTPAPAAATTAPATTTPATAEGTTAEATPPAADPMAGMSAEEHAAMDAATKAHGDDHAAADAKGASTGGMATSTQAGWYTAGTFRACGSAKDMKVDKAAEIDAQIKKGGMSAGDPVYVQVEGMPMGDSYMLTRVVQVGSKTPVRDCPMTGTTTQVGG